jgi:hypothetical protein
MMARHLPPLNRSFHMGMMEGEKSEEGHHAAITKETTDFTGHIIPLAVNAPIGSRSKMLESAPQFVF